MSQAPKCRFCEERHYGMCPKGFKQRYVDLVEEVVLREEPFYNEPINNVTKRPIVTKSVTKSPQKVESEQVTTVTTPVTTVTTQRKSTQKEIDKVKVWRSENREKYNEYMRVLRAKKDFSHLENMVGDGI